MATDTPTPEPNAQDSNGTLHSPVTEAEAAPYKDGDGTVHDPGFVPAIPREPQVKEALDDDDESVYPNYIEPESPEAQQFDGPVPPSVGPDAPAAEKPAPSQPAGAPAPKDAPAPGAPKPGAPRPEAPAPASEAEQARIDRELSHLGHRRARKVYDWLGFFGGVFALALGIVMLTQGTPDASIVFRGDFYTEAYLAMASIAFILKIGFFGLLFSVGLGLMGFFGPRLMRDDRPRRR
ncbi:hypothetical protein HGI81_07090 [Olsenella sp. KGMB02461]|nr:hypothetical protein [Olsenella sp. KGMB02461]